MKEIKKYNIHKDKFMDKKIKPMVIALQKYGFKTFESCQGGKGHAYTEPTVRFEGDEFDLIRAYEICEHLKLRPNEVRRVYWKVPLSNPDKYTSDLEKYIWDKPFNEITFY